MTTVVVTGVSRYLGAHVAARLATDPAVTRVIGLDTTPGSMELATALREIGAPRDAVTLFRTEMRSAEIAGLINDVRADVVVHLALITSAEGHAAGRAAMKEYNVIGTMQLLAACQQIPTLRKFVVRSSTAAYGASFRDPAVFTEDTQPQEVPRGGFARDILDIEGYVRGFRRRRPDVAATVLRFVPFVGRRVDTQLSRYFTLAVVPTVLGRDPRIQFVHFDDALEVVHRSVTEDHPGTFNVAGPGVLLLSQAIRRAGRIAIPVPEQGLSAAAALARALGLRGLSLDQLDLFVHGRVVDISRLAKEYGFQPRSTVDAFDDFVRAHEPNALLRQDQLAAAERAVFEVIRRVRRA